MPSFDFYVHYQKSVVTKKCPYFFRKTQVFSLKLTFNSSVIQSRHCAILARNCRLLMEYLHRCTEARFQSPSLLCSNGTLFI